MHQIKSVFEMILNYVVNLLLSMTDKHKNNKIYPMGSTCQTPPQPEVFQLSIPATVIITYYGSSIS